MSKVFKTTKVASILIKFNFICIIFSIVLIVANYFKGTPNYKALGITIPAFIFTILGLYFHNMWPSINFLSKVNDDPKMGFRNGLAVRCVGLFVMLLFTLVSIGGIVAVAFNL